MIIWYNLVFDLFLFVIVLFWSDFLLGGVVGCCRVHYNLRCGVLVGFGNLLGQRFIYQTLICWVLLFVPAPIYAAVII